MAENSHNKTLLVWNGIVSPQISGGDVYVQKLHDLSTWDYEVIAPKRAFQLLNKTPYKVHVTDNIYANMTWTQLLLYIKRTIQTAFRILFTPRRYKVAIAASPFFHDLIPCFFSRSKHRAVIFFHVIPERKSSSWRSTLRFWLAKKEQSVSIFLIRHFFDVVLAGNEMVVAQLKKHGLDAKYIITDAGIDTSVQSSASGYAKAPNSLLFMGRLTTQKGVLDLVEIMKKLPSKRFPKLTIIGDGPHKHLLEEAIKDANLQERIELVGFVSDDQKYAYLAQAEFFLFPSYEEGWGIALAEALYARCKCITYELEHYSAIFSTYPRYVGIGDTEGFTREIQSGAKYRLAEQRRFMHRYDYREVIRRVIISLDNYINK